MSTAELRKRVIERVKVSTDTALLRELDRILKGAGEEIQPYLTTSEQKRAITKSRSAVKKGKVRKADEADRAILQWLAK